MKVNKIKKKTKLHKVLNIFFVIEFNLANKLFVFASSQLRIEK